MKIMIAIAAVLCIGCHPSSSHCIEMWDTAHSSSEPVEYNFADKCCETNSCMYGVWSKNQERIKRNEPPQAK